MVNQTSSQPSVESRTFWHGAEPAHSPSAGLHFRNALIAASTVISLYNAVAFSKLSNIEQLWN
jgi:hypothetical protein